MSEKEIAKLKEEYGYAPSNYKYVPMAFELERCIGLNVILVSYNREIIEHEIEGQEEPEKEEKWKTTTDVVSLISIYDPDPLTMTCKAKYAKLLPDGNTEPEEEIRIQPEGYEFCNAEETGKFKRLQPLSLHHKMMEDEFFFARLRELFNKRDTLPVEALKTISETKNQGQVLRYSRNVGAAILLEDGDMLWIRIHTLRLKHRQGTMFGLFFSSDGREWSTIVHDGETEHTIGDWGKFKIIDLAD